MGSAPGDDGDVRHQQVVELVDAMEKGGISRGAFISRAAALGISLTGLDALLGGGAASAALDSLDRTGRVAASRILRVGDNGNGQNDTLNPHKQSAPIDGMRITSLYDRLFVNDGHYIPRPWLAQEVHSSKDAKQWTFRLVS